MGTAHMALPQPSSTQGPQANRRLPAIVCRNLGWGKSPRCLPPPNSLSRQPGPHGASPHMVKPHRDQPPPFSQKRLVGDRALSPETFSPIQNRNALHESPTLVAHGSPTHQAPFCLDEKTEAIYLGVYLEGPALMGKQLMILRPEPKQLTEMTELAQDGRFKLLMGILCS